MSSHPPTLISTLQGFEAHHLPTHADHPFSSSAEASCTMLARLVQTTSRLSSSLDSYSTMSLTNPKLISLLRQQATISHTLHTSSQNVLQTVAALRTGTGTSYGEDIPIDPSVIVAWCIERLESWAKSAGLETYKEDGREAGMLLAGTVLVAEVEFSVDRQDPLKPKLDVASVKTSYAIADSDSGVTSNTNGSISLDAFLAGSIQKFCTEVKKAEEVRDPRQVEKLGNSVRDQLRYLAMLDKLAARKQDGGISWFVDIDQLSSTLELFSKSEAKAVASSLVAPLDIYLLRCHALPLPYLVSPSISFLVYVSPHVYLTMKTSSSPAPPPTDKLPALDIPFEHLRSHLSVHPKGATLATLLLTSLNDSQLFPASLSMPSLISRPTFPLVPSGAELEHVFPQTAELTTDAQHVWILDFTQGGRVPGIVVSQSRLREMELVIHPLSMDPLNPVMMSFGTGSWVALLLNPSNPISSERYTALYRSPTLKHPPLQLRLTLPEEPGFLLEKIPVHSMKEVWGILEVVREQCWLNEILLGCHWTTEGITMDADDLPVDESDATEEELNAVLSGTVIPRKIPVSVYLPPRPDPLFEPGLEGMTMPSVDRRTRILMTCPEHPPMSGVVEVTVAYDETRARGVSVELNGAMGCELKREMLEEIARRGGTLGLPGRVWANSRVS